MSEAPVLNGAASPLAAWSAAGFADELVPVCGPKHKCGSPGKVPHVPKWQTIRVAQCDFDSWPNLGLRTRLFPAVDVDVDDAAIVAIVEEVAREIFGSTALRRRGNSARCALLYRLEGAPFEKTRIIFATPTGAPAKIEILGDGQQLVVAGVHNTGAELEWSEEQPLAAKLAPMSTATLADFLAAVRVALIAAGCGELKGGQEKASATASSGATVAPPSTAKERSFALATLRGVCKDIAGAGEGTRNDTLNAKTYKLAQLVGAGLLDRDVVEAAVKTAAERAGLPPREVDATVRSAVGAGKNAPSPRPESAATQLERAWHTVTEADLTDDPPPERYISKPRIPAGKVTVLSATGGTGKTTRVGDLVIRRALGLPDIDGSELAPGESVILTGEDGKVDYLRKFAALRVHLGREYDAAKIARRVHILDVSGIPGVEFVEADHGHLVVTAIPDVVADLIKRRAPGADLIVVETISRFGAGEDNNAHAQMVKAGERISRLRAAATLLVGHVSQAAGRAGIADQFAARGGTALSDNARSGMVMTCLTPENVAKYAPGSHLTDEEMERFVVLTHPKSCGPKAPPLMLERHSNAYGPFFTLANLKSRPQQSSAALRDQLRRLVANLTASGVVVTFTKLRNRHDEFGLTENRMEAFLDNCLADGVLVEDKSKKVQGGGYRLFVGVPKAPPDPRDGE